MKEVLISYASQQRDSSTCVKWKRMAGRRVNPWLPNSSGKNEMTRHQKSWDPPLVMAMGSVFMEQDRASDFVTGEGDLVSQQTTSVNPRKLGINWRC